MHNTRAQASADIRFFQQRNATQFSKNSTGNSSPSTFYLTKPMKRETSKYTAEYIKNIMTHMIE